VVIARVTPKVSADTRMAHFVSLGHATVPFCSSPPADQQHLAVRVPDGSAEVEIGVASWSYPRGASRRRWIYQ
jgi:hypothetical protein